eukprot:3249601-Pyramimonas_sp.AAC.1
MAEARAGRKEEGEAEEKIGNAGRCLFKAKTRHHRMVGEISITRAKDPNICNWVPKLVRRRHASPATEAFGEAPYGATKRLRGVPKWVRWRHAKAATGALGGAPVGPRNV